MFKFLEKYQWLNACTGVELSAVADGTYRCRVCSVELSGDSISIGAKEEAVGSLTEVVRKVPKSGPVALTLTGRGVLVRKGSVSGERGDTGPGLNQVFPNLKAEEFYVQQFEGAGQVFVSIIRRDVADEVLGAFEAAGVKVLVLGAGPFVAGHVLRQLNTYGDEICFDGHCVQYNGEWEWTDYRYEKGQGAEFALKVGMEPLAEQYLLAYASAFQLVLLPRLQVVSLPVEHLEYDLSEFGWRQRFRFRAAVILIVFFVLLLLNFVLFSYYHGDNEKLLSRVSQTEASTENLQQTEKEIVRSEALLKELGWSRGVSLAWIADQLGQSVPGDLVLKEMALNPLNTVESGRQRREVYDTGKILIRGEAAGPAAVNNWIYLLKGKDWVKQVNLDKFSPADNSDKQEFTMTISY